jgi:hypothetical protein
MTECASSNAEHHARASLFPSRILLLNPLITRFDHLYRGVPAPVASTRANVEITARIGLSFATFCRETVSRSFFGDSLYTAVRNVHAYILKLPTILRHCAHSIEHKMCWPPLSGRPAPPLIPLPREGRSGARAGKQRVRMPKSAAASAGRFEGLRAWSRDTRSEIEMPFSIDYLRPWKDFCKPILGL